MLFCLKYFILSAFPTLQPTPVARALAARAHFVGPTGVIFLHSATVVEECKLRSLVAAMCSSAFRGGHPPTSAGRALAVIFASSACLFLARVGIIVDHRQKQNYNSDFRDNAPVHMKKVLRNISGAHGYRKTMIIIVDKCL